MTGNDVARFTHKSVPIIFEPPCKCGESDEQTDDLEEANATKKIKLMFDYTHAEFGMVAGTKYTAVLLHRQEVPNC